MPERSSRRITWIWLLLLAATCGTWAVTSAAYWSGYHQLLAPLLFSIACVKARIILLDFIELRTSPRWLRLTGESWLAFVCLGMIVMERF